MLYTLINVIFLLPLAVLSVRWPHWATSLAAIALVGIGLFVLRNDAGRAENRE